MTTKHTKGKVKSVKPASGWCGLDSSGLILLARTCFGYTRSGAIASAEENRIGSDRKFIRVRIVPIPPTRKARKHGD